MKGTIVLEAVTDALVLLLGYAQLPIVKVIEPRTQAGHAPLKLSPPPEKFTNEMTIS